MHSIIINFGVDMHIFCFAKNDASSNPKCNDNELVVYDVVNGKVVRFDYSGGQDAYLHSFVTL
ncbi:putative ORFan [Tupanvirus deep ocean]|uniref:ORFan n=2 Tax=Tupanvirus TaxID=2094720 RepID=A0AC62A9Q6_9VIRU|nr:putative ORFan [Tupanvirus deep ocean]QKU34378.1 putative ORFan [Tupanvirus deep ocean]